MDKSRIRRNWIFFAATGLALVGFGLSLMGEALILKYEGGDLLKWFWLGTLALVVVNSGLAFFGKAITLRVRLDRQNKE